MCTRCKARCDDTGLMARIGGDSLCSLAPSPVSRLDSGDANQALPR